MAGVEVLWLVGESHSVTAECWWVLLNEIEPTAREILEESTEFG